MKQLKWDWFDHRTDLPQWLTSRIGQIVVEWTVLERELEELIQMLLNTDIGFSRIVSNRLNAQNRVLAAYSLIEWYVYHGKLKSTFLHEFNKLAKRVGKTQPKRDMVAHSLWALIERKWCVLKLRGQRPTPELGPEMEKLSRAFLPQKEFFSREKLDTIIQEIITNARAIEDFRERVYRAPREQYQYEPPKYARRRRSTKKNNTVTGSV